MDDSETQTNKQEGRAKKMAPYKVILTGHQAVGKSSLLHRIIDARFIQDYNTTIGVDFKTVAIQLTDREVQLQIWDTAGQEKFRGLTNSYFRNSQACICVYDATQLHTLEYAKGYIDSALQFGIKRECIFLVANKSDMLGSEDTENDECSNAGKEYADKLEINWEIVSAKTGKNVNRFSTSLATKLFTIYGELESAGNPILKIEDSREMSNCGC